MKYLILVALLSLLTIQNLNAIPLKRPSSESSEFSGSSESNSSSNESSNESVYVIKEVSYEIGLVGTSGLGNSTKSIVVTPEDRIETEEIIIWTSPNGPATENDNTTNTVPTEAVLATTAAAPAGPEEVKRDNTVSSSKVHATSTPSISATGQIAEETNSIMSNEVLQ